jgi:cell division protein FtsQ
MARASLLRLARPLAAALPATAGRLPAERARGRSRRRPARAGPARSHVSLGPARRLVRLLSRHRRLRIALLAGLVSLPLLVGGWRWLRHSSFVSVERVRVSGVHGPDAQPIEAALAAAARHMTTLDVNVRALRSAVAPFAVVHELHAAASFPHALSIRVIEQLPVAALLAGGARTAVAADGVVLGPALLSSGLPTLAGSSAPPAGTRVADAGLLAALTVLGAAPAPFAKVVARAFTGPSGLTMAMRNGLLAYFGDATRPHAKWLSIARVLADSSSAGASYVDVRVPEHPAAGFPAGAGPTSPASSATGASGSGEAASAAGSENTVAALAARLGGPNATEAGTNGREAAGAPSSEAQIPSAAKEGGSTTPSETSSTTAGESSPSEAGPTAPAH